MSTLSEDRNWNMSSDAASHHVLTQDTAPVTQRRESELQAVSPSRGLVSRFKSLASKAEVEHRPPSHNLEPFWDEAIAQQDFIVPRKPVPSRIDRAITDPLIETSEKLRLPQNRQSQPRSFAPAVPVLSPHLTPALSTPPPHSMDNFARLSMTNTNEPPRAAGEDAVMNEQLGNGFFRRRTSPKTKPAHTAIDVNSEDDFEAIQVKPKVPLQSRTQARKRASSPPRPLGSPAGAWSKKMRCYRGIDSSDSDEILTPSSSEDVEYPALTMPSPRQDEKDRRRSSQRVRGMERFLDSADAAQLQEHLDYNFALRLQQGEEKVYQSFYSQLRAAASQPATRRHDEEVPTRLFKGTREDPIDLNLDSDHDAVEPMDLDPDDWDRSPSSDADRTERYLDAQFARLIREEEGVQSAAVALRACAVCGDDHPISELPSLADCKHPPRTCAVCYSNWVTVQLQSNGWSEAKCPENQCKIKLSYYEVQHIATPDIFQQYDTYITRAAISEDRKSQHRVPSALNISIIPTFHQQIFDGVDPATPARYTSAAKKATSLLAPLATKKPASCTKAHGTKARRATSTSTVHQDARSAIRKTRKQLVLRRLGNFRRSVRARIAFTILRRMMGVTI